MTEEFKKEVQNGYEKFKIMCQNDSGMVLKCLDKMKEDGLLECLVGMDRLTVFEEGYIKKLLNEK